MFIDLHVHSRLSDDAGATVEGYLKWIIIRRKRGYQIDGIILTEHRGYTADVDYGDLAARYNVVVLRGSEIETDLGHFLIYGVTPKLLKELDFTQVGLPARAVLAVVKDLGGAAIAAHPGRPYIGLWDYAQQGADLDGIRIIELLNGGSNPQETERAARLAQTGNYYHTGGSDAHYVSAVGSCMTQFQRPIRQAEELVEELSLGRCKPVRLSSRPKPFLPAAPVNQ